MVLKIEPESKSPMALGQGLRIFMLACSQVELMLLVWGPHFWEPLLLGLCWVRLKVRSRWSWNNLISVWTRGDSSSMRLGLGQSSATCSWGSYSSQRAQVRARTSCQRLGLFWSCLTPVLMTPSFWVVEGTEIPINLRKHGLRWVPCCWARWFSDWACIRITWGRGGWKTPDCWAHPPPPPPNFGMVGLGWWWLRMSVCSKFPGDADQCLLAKRIKRLLCSYDWGREAAEKDVGQESLSRDWEFTWYQTKNSDWLGFCRIKDYWEKHQIIYSIYSF